MKKITFLFVMTLFITQFVCAEKTAADTIQTQTLQDVEVISTRANSKTPIAFSNLTAKQLEKYNVAKDIPFLISTTPSVITTSDTGMGIGYSGMRVRGTDPTRINITVNGVPMNDAESGLTYFVNIPDFTSSLQDIQIQRGAGTSTNGAGAFGASVNMKTKSYQSKAYSQLAASYGSYNTHKETVLFSTGLINKHWIIDGRLSNLSSDGFIDRASADLKSYYLQAGYYAGNTAIRFITFSGKEETYHAWGYATNEEMQKYGRTYNPCGEYKDKAGNTRYYADQKDFYNQQNYQLLLNHSFNSQFSVNAALHYTHGNGYYQQYKNQRSLTDYGLNRFHVFENGKDTLIKKSDLVRRKQMLNDFGGVTFALNYRGDKLQTTLGGGLNRYIGDHFGRVIWVKDYYSDLLTTHEYYRNTGKKTDGNIYLKTDYQLNKLSLWSDLQYRFVDYSMNGSSDTYDWLNGGMVDLDINKTFHFFNPKVGINYDLTKAQNLYASVSVAHKEPTRDNYKDTKAGKMPVAERLIDYELGYRLNLKKFNMGLNYYFMDYKDQLVLTGETNEIGELIASNMSKSYRTGIEWQMAYQIIPSLRAEMNATWSQNRILDYQEILYKDYVDPITIKHGDKAIAYSPDFIANGSLTYAYKGFQATWQSQYVSKQYMSNTESEETAIDAYFVNNLSLNYQFKTPAFKRIAIGFTLYNIFNHEYENNGWTERGYSLDANQNVTVYSISHRSAQAGRHFMANVTFDI